MAISIPELLAEYETRLLKDKLLEFPGKIKQQKAALRDARASYAEAAQEVALIEAEIATNIAVETDPNTGKPKFTNDKTRQAELLRRKGANSVARSAAIAMREAERLMNELQDELEALQDKFRSYRYVVRLTAEELALMASEHEPEEPGEYAQAAAKAQAAQPY